MWGIYFAYADKPEYSEVVSGIANRREAIKVADTVLRSISTDPDMRAKYRSRMKFQTDLNTTIGIREDQAREQGLAQGLEQGLEQGLAQGREQERNDIARNLFALGMPDAEIAKATGLMPDAIKRLRGDMQ
jgi:predicted transposase/invertase (TIGR01784 family)